MAKITRQFSILSTQAHVHQHRYERRSIGARIFGALRTFLFVAPLTFLIWVYADRELQVKFDDIGVAVQVNSSQSDRIVTLTSPADGQIHLDLEGSRASLESIRDALINSREPMKLLIPEDTNEFGKEIEVNAINLISQSSLFSNSPVQITHVRTPIRVIVEKRVTKSIKIIPNPNTRFVGEVKFEPETAEVSGPSGEMKKLSENVVLLADLTRMQGLAPGEHKEAVPVTLSEASTRIDIPKTVAAKVKILESKPVTLQAIPIQIQIPSRVLEMDRFRIKVEQVTLPNVKVLGPPEVIEQIVKGNITPAPAAVIELTYDEATTAGENKSKTLGLSNYRMPKDVTVVDFERTINYTVIDRGPEIR